MADQRRYEIKLEYVPSRLADGDEPWDACVVGDEMTHVHAHSPDDAYRALAKMIQQQHDHP